MSKKSNWINRLVMILTALLLGFGIYTDASLRIEHPEYTDTQLLLEHGWWGVAWMVLITGLLLQLVSPWGDGK